MSLVTEIKSRSALELFNELSNDVQNAVVRDFTRVYGQQVINDLLADDGAADLTFWRNKFSEHVSAWLD